MYYGRSMLHSAGSDICSILANTDKIDLFAIPYCVYSSVCINEILHITFSEICFCRFLLFLFLLQNIKQCIIKFNSTERVVLWIWKVSMPWIIAFSAIFPFFLSAEHSFCFHWTCLFTESVFVLKSMSSQRSPNVSPMRSPQR